MRASRRVKRPIVAIFRSKVFKPLYESFLCYGHEEFFDLDSGIPKRPVSKNPGGNAAQKEVSFKGLLSEHKSECSSVCDSILATEEEEPDVLIALRKQRRSVRGNKKETALDEEPQVSIYKEGDNQEELNQSLAEVQINIKTRHDKVQSLKSETVEFKQNKEEQKPTLPASTSEIPKKAKLNFAVKSQDVEPIIRKRPPLEQQATVNMTIEASPAKKATLSSIAERDSLEISISKKQIGVQTQTSPHFVQIPESHASKKEVVNKSDAASFNHNQPKVQAPVVPIRRATTGQSSRTVIKNGALSSNQSRDRIANKIKPADAKFNAKEKDAIEMPHKQSLASEYHKFVQKNGQPLKHNFINKTTDETKGAKNSSVDRIRTAVNRSKLNNQYDNRDAKLQSASRSAKIGGTRCNGRQSRLQDEKHKVNHFLRPAKSTNQSHLNNSDYNETDRTSEGVSPHKIASDSYQLSSAISGAQLDKNQKLSMNYFLNRTGGFSHKSNNFRKQMDRPSTREPKTYENMAQITNYANSPLAPKRAFNQTQKPRQEFPTNRFLSRSNKTLDTFFIGSNFQPEHVSRESWNSMNQSSNVYKNSSYNFNLMDASSQLSFGSIPGIGFTGANSGLPELLARTSQRSQNDLLNSASYNQGQLRQLPRNKNKNGQSSPSRKASKKRSQPPQKVYTGARQTAVYNSSMYNGGQIAKDLMNAHMNVPIMPSSIGLPPDYNSYENTLTTC